MSKSQIMKEIVELKSIVRPKITLRRVVVLGILAALVATVGPDGISYLLTAGRLASEKVRAQVPIEFELERARTMIDDLIPDVKRNLMVIAQEKAEVERTREDLELARQRMGNHREELAAQRSDVGNGIYLVSHRPVQRDEALRDLARRFELSQIADDTVKAKQQVLNAREASLNSAIATCERTMRAKRELEVKVENIKARMRQMQSIPVSKRIDFDTSKVAKIEKVLDGLDMKLHVAERLAQTEGSYEELIDSYSTPAVDDIEERVDLYLTQHATVDRVADANGD